MTDITTRNRANKRAGAKFETDLVQYLRKLGVGTVRRLRLVGREDEGDIEIIPSEQGYPVAILIEAKAEKAISLATYINELEREGEEYAAHRDMSPDDIEKVVIVKRRGRGIGDAYVVTTVDEYFSGV